MVMWTIWLLIAGILLVGEIITVGFLLFWFACGAIVGMIVSFFTSNIIIQTIAFLISSVLLLFATKPFVNKFVNKQPSVITNAYTIVGKKALVIEEIDPIKSKGLVKIGTEVWSAESDTNQKIPKDVEVEVTAIRGVKAVVKS